MNTPKQDRQRPLMRLPAKALSTAGATSEGRQPRPPGAAPGLTLEQTIVADKIAGAALEHDGLAVLRAAGTYCPGWPLSAVRIALRAAGHDGHAQSIGKHVLAFSAEKLLSLTY